MIIPRHLFIYSTFQANRLNKSVSFTQNGSSIDLFARCIDACSILEDNERRWASIDGGRRRTVGLSLRDVRNLAASIPSESIPASR